MRRLFQLHAGRRIAAAVIAGGALLHPATGRAQPLDGGIAIEPYVCGPAPEIDIDDGALMPDPLVARLIAGALLSAQETALGIRPDQLTAWRDYTGALIAMIPSGERAARWKQRATREAAGAFDLAGDVAAAAIERAEAAKRLQAAIVALKTALTPEQLRAAQQIQARLVERLIGFLEWRHGAGADGHAL
ncbi:hypothetical protein [Ancylobacter defluvii]|uniref:LTXXQ motif family protein n=1 Tax=Ancylobacter defluvii TaxID=1282440 RepID=A0A9W6JZB7_9HYPH|nr:hypothetical protein [Ancylobacter defluvii]MBS7586731.1 hypothetical protein [Ancylobacter defluvii]GLK86032.1 hypothetical protein GCM10017653_41020 [Ancylobacter defluvii]